MVSPPRYLQIPREKLKVLTLKVNFIDIGIVMLIVDDLKSLDESCISY